LPIPLVCFCCFHECIFTRERRKKTNFVFFFVFCSNFQMSKVSYHDKENSSKVSEMLGNSDNISSDNDGLPGVVGILTKTVSGLQKNMSTVFQRMSGSLQQSLAMMDSMNSCMEEYVKSSLCTHVSVKPSRFFKSSGEPSIFLRIDVRNRGRFPLSDVKLAVDLESDDGTPVNALLFEDVDAHKRKRRKLSQASHTATSDVNDISCGLLWRSCSANSETHACCELGPFKLGAGDDISWDIKLQTSKVAQYVGRLLASFPSPGSGSPLTVASSFTVLHIHQCRHRLSCAGPTVKGDTAPTEITSTAPCHADGELAMARVVPLRQLLGIPARSAVSEGLLALLDGPDGLPVRFLANGFQPSPRPPLNPWTTDLAACADPLTKPHFQSHAQEEAAIWRGSLSAGATRAPSRSPGLTPTRRRRRRRHRWHGSLSCPTVGRRRRSRPKQASRVGRARGDATSGAQEVGRGGRMRLEHGVDDGGGARRLLGIPYVEKRGKIENIRRQVRKQHVLLHYCPSSLAPHSSLPSPLLLLPLPPLFPFSSHSFLPPILWLPLSSPL
jgi:hypothetical protein